ncbi:hypothetical protein GCHA_3749 [Paraglaciecola chathamensis S18K6]|uniref:Uncharacterized protein n=1 Tax=Paraglaciecola chathamensis S18K6 TaxID=1127672 RepID=A0AAV3UXU2_9ALTE|nr:hypothetical protein GCHA_3749 [Paraglaciecola chathamensis S18K6]
MSCYDLTLIAENITRALKRFAVVISQQKTANVEHACR